MAHMLGFDIAQSIAKTSQKFRLNKQLTYDYIII